MRFISLSTASERKRRSSGFGLWLTQKILVLSEGNTSEGTIIEAFSDEEIITKTKDTHIILYKRIGNKQPLFGL